jgi:hypothetical protein
VTEPVPYEPPLVTRQETDAIMNAMALAVIIADGRRHPSKSPYSARVNLRESVAEMDGKMLAIAESAATVLIAHIIGSREKRSLAARTI